MVCIPASIPGISMQRKGYRYAGWSNFKRETCFSCKFHPHTLLVIYAHVGFYPVIFLIPGNIPDQCTRTKYSSIRFFKFTENQLDLVLKDW